MRKPVEPEYPEIQTAEQFAYALTEACVEGHHTRHEPMVVALKLWQYVGKKVGIISDMPSDTHAGYVKLYNDPDHPRQIAGGMLLVEVYFAVVNHTTYAYALSDEGWALLVTRDNLDIKEIE